MIQMFSGVQRVACEDMLAHQEEALQEALEWSVKCCMLLGIGHHNRICKPSLHKDHSAH